MIIFTRTEKGSIWWNTIFLLLLIIRTLKTYTTSGISEDCISNSQNSDEIRKEVKSSKDHDAFSLLRKQRVEFS